MASGYEPVSGTRARLRVGVVGASPDGGWAKTAHIPALQLSPQFELRAVATSRKESAEAARREFGVPSYSDFRDLVCQPELDLVVVAVKAPFHADIVEAALANGKNVYCEWPLARTLDEASSLRRLATEAGLRHFVGLQARVDPLLQHARTLIRRGYVGDVRNVAVHASNAHAATGRIPARMAYTVDPSNGTTLLSVIGGPALDVTSFLVGEISQFQCRLGVYQPVLRIDETDEALATTVPDQVLAHGILENGGSVAINIQAAKANGAHSRIEISGTNGDLVIANRNPEAGTLPIQMDSLSLWGAHGHGKSLELLNLPGRGAGSESALPPQPVLGIARLYATIASDFHEGTACAPTFDTAFALHRTLEEIAIAGARGSDD